jgi:hypothetical protein
VGASRSRTILVIVAAVDSFGGGGDCHCVGIEEERCGDMGWGWGWGMNREACMS